MEDTPAMLIAEYGTNWERYARDGRPPPTSLIQQPGEPPLMFAARVRAHLVTHGSSPSVILLCNDASDRAAVRAREQVLDAAVLDMAQLDQRGITLVTAPIKKRQASWVLKLLQRLRQLDPELRLATRCAAQPQAA